MLKKSIIFAISNGNLKKTGEYYGVETKVINQAVKNNLEKYPQGFVYEHTKEEWDVLRSKILTLESQTGRGHHHKYRPKAFTEKGVVYAGYSIEESYSYPNFHIYSKYFCRGKSVETSLVRLEGGISRGLRGVGSILFGIFLIF